MGVLNTGKGKAVLNYAKRPMENVSSHFATLAMGINDIIELQTPCLTLGL